MQYYKESEETGQAFSLEDALVHLRDMRAEVKPMLDAIASQERQIKAHVLESGEVAEVDGASVSIRKGYTRTSWDSRALKGYAVVHPEIEQFKTEKEIGPAAVIKIK
jgi:hypothetical protein